MDAVYGNLPQMEIAIDKSGVTGSRGIMQIGNLGAITGFLDAYHFILRITETTVAFHYVTLAWAGASAGAPAPSPEVIRRFAALAFDPGTGFQGTSIMAKTKKGSKEIGRSLPAAGLWTPDTEGRPFVLPQESGYLPLIATRPPA